MADDEIFEEVKYIQEGDLENHLLSPIIRCTLIDIRKRGRDKTTEPFCTPKDDARLTKDKTYFVTWYSRFSMKIKLIKLEFIYLILKKV